MYITRRAFLSRSALGAAGALTLTRWAGAQDAAPKLRLGACDWSMLAAGPQGLEVGKRIGLDGVEASAGDAADTLKIADPACLQQYKEAMAQTGLIVPSIAMGLLNNNPFATDSRAPAWLDQTIGAAKALGAKVILLAFFGKGDLRVKDQLKEKEIDAVVQRVKDAMPKAKEAGVTIGFENTLSGKDTLAIMDRVGSDYFKMYYDIGNSTYNDYDVPKEIRDLKGRICQIHFKDGGNYLGKGLVKMEPVAEAIKESGYSGWIVLETAIPSRKRDDDFKTNADYVRKLMGMAQPA